MHTEVVVFWRAVFVELLQLLLEDLCDLRGLDPQHMVDVVRRQDGGNALLFLKQLLDITQLALIVLLGHC